MLITGGQKSDKKQDIYMVSKYLPVRLIDYKEEKSNFTVEKPGRYYLSQVVEVNITSKKNIYINTSCPQYETQRRAQLHFCAIAAKLHNLI